MIITVLDYSVGSVSIISVPSFCDDQIENVEEFLEKTYGFKGSQISFMVSDKLDLQFRDYEYEIKD